MRNNDILVNNIKKKCEEQGISVSELERKLNFYHGLVSRWTKSEMVPGLDKIESIAKYFEITIDALLNKELYTELINDEKITIADIRRFEGFSESELYILERQCIESSFRICMTGKYSTDMIEIHNSILQEIKDEKEKRYIKRILK